MPTITNRTWRLQAFTDRGADPRVEFLRERVKEYEDGGTIRESLPSVIRSLADIADQPLPDGPVTISTFGELIELVAASGHHFSDEDDTQRAADLDAQEKSLADYADEIARRALPDAFADKG